MFQEEEAYDTAPVAEASIDDLDGESYHSAFERIIRQDSKMFTGAETDAERLQKLRVLTRSGEVTLAGYLTYCNYPQELFPKLEIDVAVYPGTQKSDSSKIRFVDRKVCDDAIPVMVQDAVIKALQNLKTTTLVKGVAAEDVPEIPETVLREAITNAVMHRDYSPARQNEAVNVEIYADRVVVTNPGSLLQNQTVENLTTDAKSVLRNPCRGTRDRESRCPKSRRSTAHRCATSSAQRALRY